MTPRLFTIASQMDASAVAHEISLRLRVAGPCEVYVTKLGDGNERSFYTRTGKSELDLLAATLRALEILRERELARARA